MKLVWHPDQRLCELLPYPDSVLDGATAAAVAHAMDGFLGAQRLPFLILAEASNVRAMDAGYRAEMGRFLRARRDHSRLAFYGASAIIRVGADMFRVGTGMQMKGFAKEAEARQWLGLTSDDGPDAASGDYPAGAHD